MIEKIIASCETCYKDFDIEEMSVKCSTCENLFNEKHIQSALKEVSEKTYEWEDTSMHVGSYSPKELAIYLNGVKRGYSVALFWVADWFAEIEFFEKLPIWKSPREKEND